MTGIDFYEDIYGTYDFTIMSKYKFIRKNIINDIVDINFNFKSNKVKIYQYEYEDPSSSLNIVYHIDLHVDQNNTRNKYIKLYTKCGNLVYFVNVNEELSRKTIFNYYELISMALKNAAESIIDNIQKEILLNYKSIAFNNFMTEINKDENNIEYLRINTMLDYKLQHERTTYRRR